MLKSIIPGLVAALWALAGANPVCAQPADAVAESAQASATGAAPEEVLVRGRRMADFRADLELARVRVYDVFNEINTDDAFDVSCDYEDSTGSRVLRQVCRPRFVTDIATDSARAWRNGLISACGGVTQQCIFSEGAQQGMSMAQGEESPEAMMQKRFEDELARAILQSPELQEAILDYQTLENAYLEARRGSRD